MRHFATSTLFSPQMTSAEQAQKKSILMTRHYPDLISAFVWLKQISRPARINNQKRYPDLGSDASSVWNFWARLFLRRHFAGKPVVSKCRLFSLAVSLLLFKTFNGANKSCFPAPLKLNLVFTVTFVIATAISVQCITWR